MDPDQHDLVNLEIFHNQRDTTNNWHYNNVVDLKIRCEHSPHLHRQILCSHILFSSQSQATPCKGVVSLNQCLAQNYANLLVDTRDGSILTKVSLNIAVRHL